MAFSTSKLISFLISDQRSALSSSSFSLIAVITANSLVSTGVAFPDLVSGILRQRRISELKETI